MVVKEKAIRGREEGNMYICCDGCFCRRLQAGVTGPRTCVTQSWLIPSAGGYSKGGEVISRVPYKMAVCS